MQGDKPRKPKRTFDAKAKKLSTRKREVAIKLAEKGVSKAKIAEIVGVHPTTLNAWRTSDTRLAMALAVADAKANTAVETALYKRATGFYLTEEKQYIHKGKVKRYPVVNYYKPDPASMIFWLKNRCPERWRDVSVVINPGKRGEAKTFKQFCTEAGYPEPFDKQVEMKDFVISDDAPRLLLGSRGYGKTDYAVIMGLAYELYLDALYSMEVPKASTLLVTKSESRNSAMLGEIVRICELHGVSFDRKSASEIRVSGLVGKDSSVSAVTVGTSSLRGRHPKRVIMEDVVTEEDTSEATRRKVQRAYNEVNKLCRNVAVIGQPVHKYDLYETLRPLLKKMEVPHGSIPQLDVDLEAQRLAGVSEESISASYKLKVISEAGLPFEKINYLPSLPKGDSIAFIDPSFEGSDYTALTIMKGYFSGVAVEGYLFKRAWNHCLDKLVEKMIARQVRRLAFETNSLGDQPIIMLREALLHTGIGVVGRRTVGNKHARICMAGAFADQIHLSKESDPLYIEHVTKYEYKAKFDDAPDSLASLLEWAGLIRGNT